jgi:hypothetical protein
VKRCQTRVRPDTSLKIVKHTCPDPNRVMFIAVSGLERDSTLFQHERQIPGCLLAQESPGRSNDVQWTETGNLVATVDRLFQASGWRFRVQPIPYKIYPNLACSQ